MTQIKQMTREIQGGFFDAEYRLQDISKRGDPLDKPIGAPLKTHWRVIARERSDRSNLHKSSVCGRLPRPFGARNDRTSRFLEAPIGEI